MNKERRSTIQLGRLLHNSRDALYLVNSRRRIVFFNRACEELTGVPAHRAVGLECRWHGPDDSFDLPGLAGALCPPPEALAGQLATVQSLLIHANKERSWHSINFLPLSGADGAVAAVLGRIIPAEPEAAGESPGRRRAAGEEPLRQTLARLRQRLWSRFGIDHIVAASSPMQRVLAQVKLAGQSSVPVLFRGEPGTGKESLARAIQYQSADRERPFVALDCQGLPVAALERHLSDEGFLSAAQQGVGVLYLREPIHLPRDLQARLDKLLAGAAWKGQPRIMAGGAANLLQACKDSLFLESLWHRLSTLVIDVPAVRERGPDVPLLVQQVLERCNADGDKQVVRFHADALALLTGYAWPGNLVELDAVVRQAHVRAASSEIQATDLPGKLRSAVELAVLPAAPRERPLPLDELLAQAERRLLQLALRQAKGNLSKAAARLNVSRPRLYRRMLFLGLAQRESSDDEQVEPNDESRAAGES
jgi:DNA-binding NtrC family response regulator